MAPYAPSTSTTSRRLRKLIHKWLPRIWAFTKIGGPAICSAIAVVVSVLSYLSINQANVAAVQANHVATQEALQAYAKKVSYSSGDGHGDAYVKIYNLGNADVFNISIYVTTISNKQTFNTAFIKLGIISPCSVASVSTANVLNAARLAMVAYDPTGQSSPLPATYQLPATAYPTTPAEANRAVQRVERSNGFPITIAGISFSDTNGKGWFRNNQGILSPVSNSDTYYYYPQVPFNSTQPANSCS